MDMLENKRIVQTGEWSTVLNGRSNQMRPEAVHCIYLAVIDAVTHSGKTPGGMMRIKAHLV